MDSGAAGNVAPSSAFPEIPLEESELSKNGRCFLTANKQKVHILGQKTVLIRTKEGCRRRITFQIADIGKVLVSVKKTDDQGNKVIFDSDPRIIFSDGQETSLSIEGGVYVMGANYGAAGHNARQSKSSSGDKKGSTNSGHKAMDVDLLSGPKHFASECFQRQVR